MDFRSYLVDQHEPYIEALKSLLRIPSVYQKGDEGYPFGKPIDEALRKSLEIAGDLGFSTTYGPEGYYGFAEIGEGDGLVAVLGHIDVVPAGDLDLWESGPFEPEVRDGKLFGRGAKDDKGPTLATLYAARALLDSGVEFNKRVRFIFGTDEEGYWECMKTYNVNEEKADVGFTPDAEFPLIYAEKGLLQFTLTASNQSGLNLKGGTAYNAVPDHVMYGGENREAVAAYLGSRGFEYVETEEGLKVLGQAAHAMSTEKGVNAISRLCLALNETGIRSKTVEFVANEIGEDPFGTRLFGEIEDEASGKLKCNVGKIELGEEEKLSMDVRIPVTVEKGVIEDAAMRAADRYGLIYAEKDWWDPLYVPRDHALVQTLMQVYQEETNDYESEPICSGGATYARTMKNCVAYGPQFPGGMDIEHMPNEHIVLEDMYKAMLIYAKAIYQLASR